MRDFFNRALKKINKLTGEQVQDLLLSAVEEVSRLETVLDSITQGILVCDTNHNLLIANKYAGRLLPLTYTDLGIEPIWTVVRDERAAEFLETALLNGDRIEGKEFDVNVKGLDRLLSLSVLPLVQDHRVSGSLIHVEDITEKRSKEARLRRAENLASLTTLAAGVAHEIKNPLGSISIHIQLLQKAMGEKEGDGRARSKAEKTRRVFDKYFAVINEEMDRLNRIVVDFLFAVRPMDLEFREGDINTLIRELTEFVFYELEAAHIECVLELDGDIPPVSMDERFMKQALLNLIKNAQAAMPGGGTLTIRTERVDSELRISVSDTGTGIGEENLSKIFEPYFTTRDTGSGLGLTLVYKIIREHRGEIIVKSREGEGACFSINLPILQKETRLLAFGGEAGAAGMPESNRSGQERNGGVIHEI
ncbi:MAG: PAS domain S-box protein [Treponema sp.]|jgi:PAS domain S-box-containing protein|nr:PAS domain S-box protein [Treponema sp.]